MAVDAIGGIVGSGTNQLQQTGVVSDSFIRLFLNQLSFQDPLEPVDNREFLAQLAQFSTVQQLQTLGENFEAMLGMQASSQAITLLSHDVEVAQQSGGDAVVGKVTAVSFRSGSPLLTVQKSDGSFLQDLNLSQISLVR
jgi:flagellar basal-body rod modification protein FlgD